MAILMHILLKILVRIVFSGYPITWAF